MTKKRLKHDPKGLKLRDLVTEQRKDPSFRAHFEQRRLVMQIAVAIREMREAAGLSQEQLARKIGASQPLIARLENGTGYRTPKWETLRKIGLALGMELTLSFLTSAKTAHPLVEIDGDPAPVTLEERARRELRKRRVH